MLSLSRSGQPLNSFNPATSGQLSFLSIILSPSVSGQPLNSFNPGILGQSSASS